VSECDRETSIRRAAGRVGAVASLEDTIYDIDGNYVRKYTGWTVRGSNPGGGEIFRTRSEWPWGPPSLLYNGYRPPFPGVKRPECGVDYRKPTSAEVKERVELYLYPPSGLSWQIIGWTLKDVCLYYTTN
jgi:hypothetical protein